MQSSKESNNELPPLDPEALRYLERLRDDPRFFCENELKIYDKDNELINWRWNSAQVLLFAAIWGMWLTFGYVRLLGIKGRQQGFSTLVAGLFFWLACIHGKKIIIIAHKQDSTAILFGKIETFYNNMNPILRPKTDTDNAKQYEFDNGGSITCVTAGSGEAGRGDTAQAQHRSEVAFFPDPSAVKAGVGRTVSKLAGTFIIQESTGNGENDFYHDVMKAVRGESVYQYVFVPWTLQEEYRATPPQGFTRTDEEEELVKLYGVDDEQLYWRRLTITELDSKECSGVVKFRQEYPFTLAEAFQTSTDSFFDPILVQRARMSRSEPIGHEPKLLGVDPGRVRDRTVLIKRQGCRVYEPEILKFDTDDTMRSLTIATTIAKKIDSGEVDYVFIDVGMGWGTIDQLRNLGYSKNVIPVDFGSKAYEPRFLNLRAEMFFKVLEWLKEPGARLPDDDDVSSDLAALPMNKESSSNKILFPSKEEIRKNIKRSTDILDALATTFAHPVKSKEIRQARQAINNERGSGNGNGWQDNTSRPSSLSARRHVESTYRHDNGQKYRRM